MTKPIYSNEIWRDIEGYEGYYQVSNLGRVRSLDRLSKHDKEHFRKLKGKIRKIQINKNRNNYCEVNLKKDD